MFLQYNANGEITVRTARHNIHHAKQNVNKGSPWSRKQRAKSSSRGALAGMGSGGPGAGYWHLVRIETNSEDNRKHRKGSSNTAGCGSVPSTSLETKGSCKTHTQAAGESLAGQSCANCMYSAQLLVGKAWQQQAQGGHWERSDPGKGWCSKRPWIKCSLR